MNGRQSPLLIWEAVLTFATICSASLSLTSLIPSKIAAFLVIIVQALNGATVVYKTGQWNPPPSVVASINATNATNTEGTPEK